MPTIGENLEEWGQTYAWPHSGDEWSAAWGGPESQWRSCILPRIARFLPADSILEIAPGFGRWAQYLIPRCSDYIGVDLAERCVTSCINRFSGREGVRFAVNDGRSLPMVLDSSVDLLFSFDSLVHAEKDVISSYLTEFRRVLRNDGIGFIHHSNVGVYQASSTLRDVLARIGQVPPMPRTILRRVGLADWHQWRARSMTAELFFELSSDAGLVCIGQEIINWASPLLVDCISVVTQPGSIWERPNVRTTNRRFRVAASSSAAAAHVFLSMKVNQG
jgi:ubiquinone/menaquinone biosynthesis C-methylase UbiE